MHSTGYLHCSIRLSQVQTMGDRSFFCLRLLYCAALITLRENYSIFYVHYVVRRANFRDFWHHARSNINSQIYQTQFVRLWWTAIAFCNINYWNRCWWFERPSYQTSNHNVANPRDESDARKCGLTASRAEIVPADLPDTGHTRAQEN